MKGEPLKSGEPCPRCDAVLQVVNTKIVLSTRRRYIGCRNCGFRPPQDPFTVPLSEAPKQRTRAWQKECYSSPQRRRRYRLKLVQSKVRKDHEHPKRI